MGCSHFPFAVIGLNVDIKDLLQIIIDHKLSDNVCNSYIDFTKKIKKEWDCYQRRWKLYDDETTECFKTQWERERKGKGKGKDIIFPQEPDEYRFEDYEEYVEETYGNIMDVFVKDLFYSTSGRTVNFNKVKNVCSDMKYFDIKICESEHCANFFVVVKGLKSKTTRNELNIDYMTAPIDPDVLKESTPLFVKYFHKEPELCIMSSDCGCCS